MKRVALCAAVLLVIILLCTASLVTVSRYQHHFTQALQDLEQAVYQETFERLSGQAADICRDWIFPREKIFCSVTISDTRWGYTNKKAPRKKWTAAARRRIAK